MPAFADRGATVNRLRIRSRMDPLTARVRASWLLDESALQPPTLPPSAILCIRRLTDPRPGTVALERTQLPPRGWSDAVAGSVATLARQARRPAHGDGAADAEAVMFADRAELLACLAADWCGGQLPARWWWRALLDDAGDARAVLRAWLAMPAYIAASIDELATRGAATTFVERLSGADTRALLDAVVVQHGLTWLTSAIEPLNHSDRVRSDVAADDSAREAGVRPERGALALEGTRRAPWSGWAPESRPQRLRADQQCLLGIALTTRRAPTVVRSAPFAADVRRWCLDATRADATSDTTDSTPVTRRDYRLDRAIPVTRVQDDNTLDDTTDRDQADAAIGQAGHFIAQTTDGIESSHRAAAVEQVTSPDVHAPEPDMSRDRGRPRRPNSAPLPHVERDTLMAHVHELSAGRPVAQSIGTSTTSDGLETPAGPVEPSHVSCMYPVSIETDVGGVFYLLNVALSLGLYSDFTAPLQPGIDLSVWDFLTLAGRRLTPPRFQSDALWGFLAECAGGKGTKGGIGRMGGKRWMRQLLPRVRARLALALPGVDRRRLGPLVCRHRARVVTSPTHVDVMFSLAELPIEVRLSGLDRDPGWVPAADRVIAFHYE